MEEPIFNITTVDCIFILYTESLQFFHKVPIVLILEGQFTVQC